MEGRQVKKRNGQAGYHRGHLDEPRWGSSAEPESSTRGQGAGAFVHQLLKLWARDGNSPTPKLVSGEAGENRQGEKKV